MIKSFFDDKDLNIDILNHIINFLNKFKDK